MVRKGELVSRKFVASAFRANVAQFGVDQPRSVTSGWLHTQGFDAFSAHPLIPLALDQRPSIRIAEWGCGLVTRYFALSSKEVRRRVTGDLLCIHSISVRVDSCAFDVLVRATRRSQKEKAFLGMKQDTIAPSLAYCTNSIGYRAHLQCLAPMALLSFCTKKPP